ncbi:hypothetical protein [Rhodomicrobium lacus]|uniref:hypothetical protein n=1 Tax=Rhodomicrobium lacus TaxID=2498452 RepID=UPI000F8D8ED7|nr:hypothetical protein [Rhodomicrobium lacus]
MNEKQKSPLTITAIRIVERCVAGALAVVGASTISSEADAKTVVPTSEPTPIIGSKLIAEAPSAEGAILLNLVHRDPATGELVADHYSHASHSSHASHHSHYSSR